MELWLEHPKYKGLFISSEGNFMRKDKKPVKVIPEKENGYLRISYKGVRDRCHVLVAETWLKRPSDPKKKIVHHKDGCKHNNRPSNLEYRTNQENIAAAGREGKLATTAGDPTPVVLMEVGTDNIRVFGSQKEAAEALGVHNSTINKALRGGRKTAAGYKCVYLHVYEGASK